MIRRESGRYEDTTTFLWRAKKRKRNRKEGRGIGRKEGRRRRIRSKEERGRKIGEIIATINHQKKDTEKNEKRKRTGQVSHVR